MPEIRFCVKCIIIPKRYYLAMPANSNAYANHTSRGYPTPGRGLLGRPLESPLPACLGIQTDPFQLALAPLQLRPQNIEESVVAEAHQLHGMIGAAAAQLVVDAQLDGFLAVDGEVRLFRDGLDPHQNL